MAAPGEAKAILAHRQSPEDEARSSGPATWGRVCACLVAGVNTRAAAWRGICPTPWHWPRSSSCFISLTSPGDPTAQDVPAPCHPSGKGGVQRVGPPAQCLTWKSGRESLGSRGTGPPLRPLLVCPKLGPSSRASPPSTPSAPRGASTLHLYNGRERSQPSMAPSVHNCVTDGRDPGRGAWEGASSSQGVRQSAPQGRPLVCQRPCGQQAKRSHRAWERRAEKGLEAGSEGKEIKN